MRLITAARSDPPSARRKPSGVGGTLRPSTTTTDHPRVSAQRWKAASRLLLPTPPGPLTLRTSGEVGEIVSHCWKTASSRCRPEKSRSSKAWTASPRVGIGVLPLLLPSGLDLGSANRHSQPAPLCCRAGIVGGRVGYQPSCTGGGQCTFLSATRHRLWQC